MQLRKLGEPSHAFHGDLRLYMYLSSFGISIFYFNFIFRKLVWVIYKNSYVVQNVLFVNNYTENPRFIARLNKLKRSLMILLFCQYVFTHECTNALTLPPKIVILIRELCATLPFPCYWTCLALKNLWLFSLHFKWSMNFTSCFTKNELFIYRDLATQLWQMANVRLKCAFSKELVWS